MLTTLLYLSFVMLVSAGNLALGYGLAVHLGHGPSRGWLALCFWKRSPSEGNTSEQHSTTSKPAETSHGH